MAALGVVTEKLRLYRHFVNGVLLITFVLACTIPVGGKELYEFLAVTKVDGLPPAPSFQPPKKRQKVRRDFSGQLAR